MFATMLGSAAGSLCVGKKEVVGMAVQKGQVVLDCPVAPGAPQIKQSIIIAYVKSPISQADPTTTTVRAVTLSATGDLGEPDDPQNRADAPSGGDEGLVTAVVNLSFLVLLLLLIGLRGSKNAGKGGYSVANGGII